MNDSLQNAQVWYDPELGSQIGLDKYINNDSLRNAQVWYDPELGSQTGLDEYINNKQSPNTMLEYPRHIPKQPQPQFSKLKARSLCQVRQSSI